MLSSSLDTLLKVSKTTSPQTLFAYDCVTLYVTYILSFFYPKPYFVNKNNCSSQIQGRAVIQGSSC